MTEKEYRASEGISRSELWLLNPDNGGTPEKFKWAKEHPQPATQALIFGQAVHKLLLEPDSFDDEFVVAPEGLNRTAVKGWEKFCKDFPTMTAISLKEFNKAREMVSKALSYQDVRDLLKGQHEKPIFWTDEQTGIKCKCRTDNLHDEPKVVDYKTTRNASTRFFSSAIYRYGYNFQAGMYCEGVMKHLGLNELPPFTIIAQETEPPYAVNWITLPKPIIIDGNDSFHEALGIYKDCVETGYWYGYNGAFDIENEAQIPGWLQIGTEDDEE